MSCIIQGCQRSLSEPFPVMVDILRCLWGPSCLGEGIFAAPSRSLVYARWVDLLGCIWFFENFCKIHFFVFFGLVVHHPPVGRTKLQENTSFLPETFFHVLFCRQVPPSAPSATAVWWPHFPICLHIFLWLFFSFSLHVDVSLATMSTIAQLSCPTSAVLPGHEGSFAHFDQGWQKNTIFWEKKNNFSRLFWIKPDKILCFFKVRFIKKNAPSQFKGTVKCCPYKKNRT